MSGQIVLGGLITNRMVKLENTEIVNEGVDWWFMYFTIPVWVVTLLLNLSVITILWENKTIINQYMIFDCLVSMVFSSLATFQQSPYFVGLNSDVFCIVHMTVLMTCTQANRLLPIMIASYRWGNTNIVCYGKK